LAKMARVKFDAHHNLTTVDPPELVYHVRKHKEVIIDKPEKTMWELIRYNKGTPPQRISRYCCKFIKERGGKGRWILTGIRKEESPRRANRNEVEECYRKNQEKYFVHPIFHWSTKDVWDFIRQNNIEYCSLYDKGYHRIGCVLCPFHSRQQRLREMKEYPKIAEAYKRAIRRGYEARRRPSKYFLNSEEQFDWWISGLSVDEWKQLKRQSILF
ncbi:MAG: phosphoadenosine phosphosulfate reductase family protein, partial [Syntrophorhabdaceae bacterium]|nr:phosphoadenosine phosphosulfate reductase family protein [Syntrophorhabdaceae bacterium]